MEKIYLKSKDHEMTIINSKPLIIVFAIMIVFFLLFCGGALIVTFENSGMSGNGMMYGNKDMMGSIWSRGISWMWMPTLLFLTLSILLARVIFGKKNLSDNDNKKLN